MVLGELCGWQTASHGRSTNGRISDGLRLKSQLAPNIAESTSFSGGRSAITRVISRARVGIAGIIVRVSGYRVLSSHTPIRRNQAENRCHVPLCRPVAASL